ncbi:hypothetical protein ACFY19_01140 [Streptosporangium saharense]
MEPELAALNAVSGAVRYGTAIQSGSVSGLVFRDSGPDASAER